MIMKTRVHGIMNRCTGNLKEWPFDDDSENTSSDSSLTLAALRNMRYDWAISGRQGLGGSIYAKDLCGDTGRRLTKGLGSHRWHCCPGMLHSALRVSGLVIINTNRAAHMQPSLPFAAPE